MAAFRNGKDKPVRRYVITAAVFAALVPAAAASATTEPPEPTEPTEPTGTMVAETTAPADTMAPTVTAPTDTGTPTGETTPAGVYDDSGNAVASITVTGSETGVSDYEEGNDPEAGREYVRVTVNVESLITEGTFNVNVDDFVLQDNNGFLTTAETVKTAAQAENDEEISDDVDLGNGESVELVLTFEVVSSVGPQSVFWRADDDRLVDVFEFA